MAQKGPKQIVFVCSAIQNAKIVSEIIEKRTTDEACEVFMAKFQVRPEIVQGPFYRKRTGVLQSQTDIKFKGEHKNALYEGWVVTALFLEQPAECAWLFFEFNIENKKAPKPKSIIVREDSLKFLTTEEFSSYKNN